MNSASLQYSHVRYWLGLHLRDYFPDMAAGPHAEIIAPYFQHMRLLLVEGLVLGDVSINTIRRVTARELYQSNTSSFPPPKIVFKYDVDWSQVWKRLEYPVLEPIGREYLFSLIHNIVPNRERLFSKMHLVNSPNCLVCGVRESNVHVFSECFMVREAWGWTRRRMLEMLPEENARCSNFELLNLMFEHHVMDVEAVWLMATYVEFVWFEKLKRNRTVKIEYLIGHLKLRYRANQVSRRPQLEFMSWIS